MIHQQLYPSITGDISGSMKVLHHKLYHSITRDIVVRTCNPHTACIKQHASSTIICGKFYRMVVITFCPCRKNLIHNEVQKYKSQRSLVDPLELDANKRNCNKGRFPKQFQPSPRVIQAISMKLDVTLIYTIFKQT